MSKNIILKQSTIKNLSPLVYDSVIVADVAGVPSNAMNNLRKDMRHLGVFSKVLKNTLSRKLLSNTTHHHLVSHLTFQNCLFFPSQDNMGETFKTLIQFQKINPTFKVKCCSHLDLLYTTEEEIDLLSKIPTRTESFMLITDLLVRPLLLLSHDLKQLCKAKTG